MTFFEWNLRVRYGETDRMGFVYYGNYAEYFEVARVEMLRSLGVSYRQLEDQGILLPVLDFSIKYIKPAFYDEMLRIKISVADQPGVRITFDYETFNEKDELLNKAKTTLVFVDKQTGKPTKCPDEVLNAFKEE